METSRPTSLSLNLTIEPSLPLTKPQMDSINLDLTIEHQPQPNDKTSISTLLNVQLTIELQPQPQPYDGTSTLT